MKVLRSLGTHSPEILIGCGIAGMVVSTILAVKATPKAMKLREETMLERDAIHPEWCEKRLIIKACLPCYLPSIIVSAASIACIVGGSATNYKRNAALAAALHMSEASIATYKEKVKEIVGEEKAKEVQKAVIEDDIRRNISSKAIPIMGNGDTLCYDTYAGRPFYSSQEKLRAAALTLNEELFDSDRVTLNAFYYELGLSDSEVGELLAWDMANFRNVGRKTRIIDLTFNAVLIDGVPYLAVGFKIPPTY